MRLAGLEIEARPNYWPSFCKAFPQSNRQLGNSRAITQTFPLEFARVKPQCLIVSTRVGNRMRESCTYGSVRGARGNSRPYRYLAPHKSPNSTNCAFHKLRHYARFRRFSLKPPDGLECYDGERDETVPLSQAAPDRPRMRG